MFGRMAIEVSFRVSYIGPHSHKVSIKFSSVSDSLRPPQSSVKSARRNQGDGVHDGLHPHTAIQSENPVHKKQQRNIQHTLSENGADQRLPGFAHGLKL